MNDIILVSVSAIITAIILILISLFAIKRTQNGKFKKRIENLDIEKNQIVGVSVMSELAKVRELIKTENLKEKLSEWDAVYNEIREERLNKVSELIAEADYLVSRNEIKAAIKKIANIEMELKELRTKSNFLLGEIKVITNSEERNRALVTKLKVVYRELQNKFERTRKDYGDVSPSIVLQFETINKLFQEFENTMDNNDYVSVEKIVSSLNEAVTNMQNVLEEVPSIILMSSLLIPKKIEEISTHYARMIRDGYPLDYLNVEYNIKEINNKIEVILNRIKLLQLDDSLMELKTILEYLNQLTKDFEKEKESKNIFNENAKIFRNKLSKVNSVVKDIYLSLDDIRATYDLKEEDINKFSVLNRNLEVLGEDYKKLIEHSKSRIFAFSHLSDELDDLSVKLNHVEEDLDYQLHSISSMKDDEYRAKEQLDSIQGLLRQSKNRIKDFKMPVIPNDYFIELREAQDAIKEIIKELDKKPIVIRILNIRVDTARDLVFKIYNKTNEIVKIAMMAERTIIYGNRYRSEYEEIDRSLKKAEELFNKGMYQSSLDISINTIETVERDIREKLTLN